MARNKGIFSLSDRSAVCATLTPLPCSQPVRLRGRLLGALWAVLAASLTAPSLASLPVLHAVTEAAALLIQRTE